MRLTNSISVITGMFYTEKSEDRLLPFFWNSLYIAFFLLPLGINLPTPFFIIAIVLGCMNIFRSKRNFVSGNRALLLFPLYFLVMCLSLLYTDNLEYGMELIQRSVTLFLFPLIFLYVKEDALSVRKLFEFLLMGLVLSFFINLVIAVKESSALVINEYSSKGIAAAIADGWDSFIGIQFSRLINPGYLSLYILLVLSFYLKKKVNNSKRFTVVLILFLYLFLLASKAAYLILFIMSLLLLFKVTERSRRFLMYVIFMLATIVFLNNPRLWRSDHYDEESMINPTISMTNRLRSWETAVKAISESPLLGYGIGDAHDRQILKYKELGYLENFNNRYNTHNQFLQTWMQTGIPGFALLLFIFMLLAFKLRRSNYEFSVFLILFISLMFESMLVRFNGIVFFSIVVPLLLKERSILGSTIIRNN